MWISLSESCLWNVCKESANSHLDGTIIGANIIKDGADTQAQSQVYCKAKPVITEVTVHVYERSLCQHKTLCNESRLLASIILYLSNINLGGIYNQTCLRTLWFGLWLTIKILQEYAIYNNPYEGKVYIPLGEYHLPISELAENSLMSCMIPQEG